jgi:hypothetical protein
LAVQCRFKICKTGKPDLFCFFYDVVGKYFLIAFVREFFKMSSRGSSRSGTKKGRDIFTMEFGKGLIKMLYYINADQRRLQKYY